MVKEFSLDLLSNEKNQVTLLLDVCGEALKKESKPIVLFGAGGIGQFYLSILKRLDNLREIYFCDNNSNKWGQVIDGVPVISFNELNKKYRECYIIVTSLAFYHDLRMQLEEKGLKPLLDLSIHSVITDDIHFYDAFQNYKKFISDHLTEFSTVYRRLEDEFSRRVYIDRLNYCITLNTKYLAPLKSVSSQYFERGIVSISDNEIFIDGGGYTGDTVDEFIKQTDGKFSTIYSFEPEISKHMEFQKKVKGYKNVHLIDKGLWSNSTVLKFNALGSGSSNVDKNGDILINVTSIDEFLQESPVTFIKMDIEGVELEALKGAEQSIKKYRPKLAICVYHKPEDIIEIPLYLNEIVPTYKFYLRHYNYGGSETVLYAIPSEVTC
ncbi:FkbM family methyltransferase [Bacillus sp. HMF5848]|uniref:FkbM family methyltransferase n=1 Tax=Bacillus sp. HMF5848 TaxID=2495421 RepID=UPI000F7AA9AE|nr:FkbM family methyltransferase [Bacillus sp. HMF5848]RSK28615.1 FkbM family methyltransferase [Bacillus sp. HMF5848]